MITAFVLAGGGSLGAIEVGMLRALLEHGERPDLIVGASAGAINGAYFAGDPTLEGVARMEATWRTLGRSQIFPLGFSSVIALMLRRDYLVRPDALRRLLEAHLAYGSLERAALPIHVVATELLSGDEVVLSRGPAVEAVLASAAIPGVFPSVTIAGRVLVDGGISNNTPISAAIGLDAQRILVLPTGFACALKQVPTTAIGKALHSLNLLVARRLVIDIARYSSEVELHLVPPLCPLDVSPSDYEGCGALIDRAAQTTRAWIAAGGLTQAPVAGALAEHQH